MDDYWRAVILLVEQFGTFLMFLHMQCTDQCFCGGSRYATRAFATPIFVASATPIFVASATPYFRISATQTAATPKILF